ncbi:MAG: tRNA (adenosine(37)-N6)-threonylcarbamoyltransferase complex dimerization subunit type 1 TsaB [Acidobacteriota bacterium]
MQILAIDTTSRAGSIALLQGEELRGLIGFARALGHAETLLPTVKHLLNELDLRISDLDAFSVSVGPGSFTGLRVGIATAEGLAFATGRRAVGVSALEATAYRYRFCSGLVASFLDAGRGEVFGALYGSDGQRLEAVSEPVCEDPRIFLDCLPQEPILLAGSGTVTFQKLLHAVPGRRLSVPQPSPFLAEDVARIGLRLHEEGKAASLGGLEAIYLRASDAERARQDKSGAHPWP